MKRSPLANPTDNAYEAPSENPLMATCFRSTAHRSKVQSSAASIAVMSSPNPSRRTSQVRPRESGARMMIPPASARGVIRATMLSALPPAPWSSNNSGKGRSGA